MSQSRRLFTLGMCTGLCVALTSVASAQSEKLVIGQLKGDQTKPKAVVGPKGGMLVWQDNAIDSNGMGVGFVRLNPDGSAIPGNGLVNVQKVADQENPDIALLSNNNTAVVWQGGKPGAQQVFMRIFGPKVAVTGDLLANTYYLGMQVNPHIAANTNSILVTWTSYRDNGAQTAVYGQFYNNAGVKWGTEFKLNTYAKGVCRGGEVASLKNSSYVAGWVAEDARSKNSVDIYAKIYSATRAVVANEFLVNTSQRVCTSPVFSATPDGGFIASWSEKDYSKNGQWNVYARKFSANGTALIDAVVINDPSFGNAFGSQVSATSEGATVLWTNTGRDGSAEGVFGRRLSVDLQPIGTDFQINDRTKGRQLNPTIYQTVNGAVFGAWGTPNIGTGYDLVSKKLQ